MSIAEVQLSISRKRITPQIIEEFGQVLRAKLIAGDPNFRRSFVALLVDEIMLSAKEIRIIGTRLAFEHLLVSDKPSLIGAVPIFGREWCPEEDSNLHGLATAST